MQRLQPGKASQPTYRQVWRIVDGAVHLALSTHPEYLASGANLKTVRNSIVKRVTGAICGYAEQSAWVRSGSSPADEKIGPAVVTGPIADEASCHFVGRAAPRIGCPAGGGPLTFSRSAGEGRPCR